MLALAAGCATSGKESVDPAAERIAALETAAAVSPQDARAQYTLGNAYFDAQRYADARAAYERTTMLDPAFADAFTNLGLVYRIEGNLEAAITQYEKALAIAPADAVTRRNLIIALDAAGRFPEAAAQLAELSRQDPEDIDLLRLVAARYQQLEAFPEAEAAYIRLLAQSPADPTAWLALGVCQQAQGETDTAIVSWTRAIALDAHLVPAHEALLSAYTQRGEYAKAWAEVREIQQLGGFVDPQIMERLQEATGQLGPE